MRKKLLVLAMAVISAVGLLSCGVQKIQSNALQHGCNDVVLTRNPHQNYYDLTYGIDLHVVTTNPRSENTTQTYHLSDKSFFSLPTIQYVRSMGLAEKSPNTDFQLYITINKADVGYPPYAEVDLGISLKNHQGVEVFSQNVACDVVANTRMKTQRSNTRQVYPFALALDEAYTQALEQINWNRIASFLRTEQLPQNEPQNMVQGLGNTALEQTIIRWDVQSRPQGADIFWRVVSTTPEVKGTNNKYLMTTPYEATKALDIRGLTYQTAGNVRIILRCEKDGYLPQEKEYDVRMVLDQEEISAFFRLVKEE